MMVTNSEINTTNPIGIVSGGTSTASFSPTNGTVYYSGTQLVATATGTAGQALTSAGGLSAPTYQNLPSGSGAWVLLETQVASSSASLVFSTGISSTYSNYVVMINSIVPDTSGQQLKMLFSTDGGATYLSTYKSGAWYYDNNPGTSQPNGTGTITTSIILSLPNLTYTGDVTVTPSIRLSGMIYMFSLTNNGTNIFPSCLGDVTHSVSSGSPINWITLLGQVQSDSVAVDAIKFSFDSGNIDSGSISLFGISK